MKYHLRLNKLLLITSLLIAPLTVPGCGQKKSDDPGRNDTGRRLEYVRQVTFLDSDGEPVATVDVALADEPSERNMGLMDVARLPSDKGMLFIFENSQPRSFWMANTPLSLDIIFANSDLEIVRIHTSTRPFSENNFNSDAPSKYVVEVNGGFCVSNDIQEGMKIEISKPGEEM